MNPTDTDPFGQGVCVGPRRVYAAVVAVAGGLAKNGIAKGRQNVQQKYAFRGIDDIYNALAPLLAEHNLCILPRVLSREVTERKSQAGGALFSVTVHVAYDIVCAEDGSRHEVVVCGEAMDSGDKATNKAMSAAYKYLCLQAFCIPTEGDNDADATTHAVAPVEHVVPADDGWPFSEPIPGPPGSALTPQPQPRRGGK